MDFRQFEKQIVKIKKMELPGQEVQLKMAPVERLRELSVQAKQQNSARKAAVMALFYPDQNEETHLVLILRKKYKGVHSAQVGFPGGKLESDDASMMAAALRETEEEIGVSVKEIEVVRDLSEIYIPPSNFFVKPFLGITHATPKFVAEEKEVEEIIEVKLEEFLDNGCVTTDILTTSYALELEVPAFKLSGYIVWGATAMMLNELREMLLKLL